MHRLSPECFTPTSMYDRFDRTSCQLSTINSPSQLKTQNSKLKTQNSLTTVNKKPVNKKPPAITGRGRKLSGCIY
ncbi:MAG: hypothetical protein ACRC62_08400 [Microcoleus sp.]